jgi:hypothetical protein
MTCPITQKAIDLLHKTDAAGLLKYGKPLSESSVFGLDEAIAEAADKLKYLVLAREQVGALVEENATLRQQVETLRKIVKRMEFGSAEDLQEEDTHFYCVICGNREDCGHEPDCSVAVALAATEPKEGK